jgi:GNAT superfamily N-acetyltransferase
MIEKASSQNAEEILSVINTSNRAAYKSIIPEEYFREPALSLEKLLEDFERMLFYTYKSESRVTGVAALGVESRGTGRIRRVYVLPEYQRKGIGSALMTHLERKAKEMGLTRLRVRTVEKAIWAVHFYNKLGYDLTDRIERHGGFDVILEKELQPPE